MIKISQPSGGSGGTTNNIYNTYASDSVRKIASGVINAAVLATTDLAWESDCAMSNTVPMFMIIRKVTGTFALAAMSLKIDSAVISSVDLSALASEPMISSVTLSGSVDGESNFSVLTTAVNLTASTFSVDIYGMKY